MREPTAFPWPLQTDLVPAEAGHPELSLLRSDGRPAAVLFVHGACCTAQVWASLMQSLRSLGLPSAALNLRGHGASAGHERLQEWTLRDYEQDVLRALDAAAEPEPLLVGHSMGGLIAQRVATQVRLRGLVLLASSPVHGMRRDGLRMLLRHPLTFLAASRQRSVLRLYRDEAVCRALLLGPRADTNLSARLHAGLVEESWQAAEAMNFTLPDPKRVRCPVGVFGGSEDAMVSRASVRRTAHAYGVAPEWLAGCGHMLPLEASSERLALSLASQWSRGERKRNGVET